MFRQRFLYSMGVGGALCALIAALVSLTLLPALLGALGERVNAGGPRRWKEAIAREAAGERSGFWYRHSQRVMRRPVAGRGRGRGAADRAGAAVPADRVHGRGRVGAAAATRRRGSSTTRCGRSSRRARPRRSTSRSVGRVGGGRARVRGAAAGAVEPRGCRAGRIDLIAPGPPLGAAGEGVRRGGAGRCRRRSTFRWAGRRRSSSTSRRRCARTCRSAFAILCATTLIILFFMTRSVVLPVKALIMNLLTLSAAFGLLVLVFQDGHLEWLLRVRLGGRDRVLAARAAVRGRVRAVDRLRRVPAGAHQGAARRGDARTRRRWRSGCSGRGGS